MTIDKCNCFAVAFVRHHRCRPRRLFGADMKRRTLKNLGVWPNMRDDTIKQISGELIRARTKHKSRDGNLQMLLFAVSALQQEISGYDADVTKCSASQIWARGGMIAAMAIRIMEEGSYQSKYQGNNHAPDFELTP